MRIFVAPMGMTLRDARARKGWKVEDVAERSGVSRATVYRIEAGEIANPSYDTVQKLELALRLKRGTLVFGQVMEKSA